MELNKNKFAFAASIVMGALYVSCLALSYIAPVFTLKMFGLLIHLINLESLASGMSITILGAILGFMQSVVYTFVLVWIFAGIYNKLIKDGGLKA